MRHLLTASVLVVVLIGLLLLGLRFVPLLPGPPESTQGVLVDRLFHWEMYLIAVVFGLVVGFMLYAIVVFRRKPGDTAEGPNLKTNMPLEITWTVIPLCVVIALAIVSGRDLKEMLTPSPDELVVEVTGYQWGWRFYYPDPGLNASELVLPANRPIAFKLTSLDVIHDFWVVEWRIKQDAVPGQWHTLRITPTALGTYTMRCNELCGFAHAQMIVPVRVVQPEEYQAWLKQQAAGPASAADQGKGLVQQMGCQACHTLDGSAGHGPTFKGLYGSQVKLADGSSVLADDAYMARSIRDPAAQVVAGFAPQMPAAYGGLSDQEIQAIVEYIKGLR